MNASEYKAGDTARARLRDGKEYQVKILRRWRKDWRGHRWYLVEWPGGMQSKIGESLLVEDDEKTTT